MDQGDRDDVLRSHEGFSPGLHQQNRRLIKEKEREIEKVNHELSVQSDKLQGQEDYALIL